MSLSLALLFLIVLQLGNELRLIDALLWNMEWFLEKAPIRQKDNWLHLSVIYNFLITGDLFSLNQIIHKATSGGSLNMELMVPIVLNS